MIRSAVFQSSRNTTDRVRARPSSLVDPVSISISGCTQVHSSTGCEFLVDVRTSHKMMSKMNPKGIKARPQEFLRREAEVVRNMSLASVEDKRLKEQVFLADPYRAAKYLNLKRNLKLDGDGHPSLQGVQAEDLYHTRDTLKKTDVWKLVDTSYPSPDGNDCYKDVKLWEAAQYLCRIKGRMLPIVMKKILEMVEEQFDMSGYGHNEEDGDMAALCTIGRMYIDGINLCMMEVDNI